MADWIAALMADGGYWTVALLMFLENVFPPIPSELIMPLAGYAARQGDLSLPLVIAAGSAGSLAGAWFWFLIATWFSAERLKRLATRHGRWLTVGPQDIDRADAWFDRHGGAAVLFGRMVPGIRTLISVPAGLSGMPLGRFLLYSAIGTLGWVGLLGVAGWVLGGAHELVAAYIDPVSKAIMGVLVLVYLYRVVTFRPAPANPKAGPDVG